MNLKNAQIYQLVVPFETFFTHYSKKIFSDHYLLWISAIALIAFRNIKDRNLAMNNNCG